MPLITAADTGRWPKPIFASDVDGTIFKSSLTAKIVAACIQEDVFQRSQFKKAFMQERRWQQHNTEENYTKYLGALVEEFIVAIKGVRVGNFDKATAKMIRQHRVRRFGFTTDLRWLTQHSHAFVGISGSPTVVVEPFLANLFPDRIFGSHISVQDGVFIDAKNVGQKAGIINHLVAQGIVALQGSIAIGDTINDAPMLSLATVPIMFNPSKTLLRHGAPLGWHWVMETKDNITYLQPSTDPDDYRVRPVQLLYDKIAAVSSQTT